ncbi:MAG: DUF99 family protein [Promethearchaeota archaeon]|nr:MAG: DUF99 family protein [Candidatus Lokiarchaeota archaeon]
MKENPIIIGFDDATFNLKAKSKTTQLIGVICQGIRMVNVVSTEIIVDGNNATERLIELVKQNQKHIQFILTHTITFGGFNLINLNKIYSEIRKPVIAVNDRRVDLDSVRKAIIYKFPNTYKEKIQNIVDAGNLYQTQIETAGGISIIYFHSKGIENNKVDSLLQKICVDSKLPECLRLAHLIGRLF